MIEDGNLEVQNLDMCVGSESKVVEEKVLFDLNIGENINDVEEKVLFDLNIGEAHLEDDTCSYVEGSLCSNEIGKCDVATSNMVESKGAPITGFFDLNGSESLLQSCTFSPVHGNQGLYSSPGMEGNVRRGTLIENSSSGVETTLRRSRRRLAIMKNVQNGVCGDHKDVMDIDYEGNSGSTVRRRKRRKKMEILDHGSSVIEALYIETQSSAAVGTLSNKPFTTEDCQQLNQCSVFCPKLKLPVSSEKLDLDGIPILDLFSVYTCLRSFSTSLFLSPFDIEDLVAAIRCNSANVLFDCIHVSLLQTLRKQMVLDSDEIKSASICLRNLNWDLLDSITWPNFMVDYMLIHGSTPKSSVDLPKLKLFEREYYNQEPFVKIEMLRCLCDDVIEVEAIRSELNRRMLATDPNIYIDLKTDIKRRKTAKNSIKNGYFFTEVGADETADRNSDECFLCKMDGNLICCDGCPAAYHMKCVGVSTNSLPDGDWYCPECSIDKEKPWLKMGRSLRGAEILGVDPYGRVYYISAGYLLVLDSCEGESSCQYYYINNLTAIIEELKSSGPLYKPILHAISKYLDIYVNCIESKDNYAELMKEQIFTSDMLQQRIASPESRMMDLCLDKNLTGENLVSAQYSDKESDQLAKEMKLEYPFMSFVTSRPPGSDNFTLDGSDAVRKRVKNIDGDIGNSTSYVNLYSFSRISSMVVEELTGKSVDKVTETKPHEDIYSLQLKAVIKASTKFFWPVFKNLSADERKEKCGWCFTCRAQDTDNDYGSKVCLFNLNVYNPQDYDNETVSFLLKNSMGDHLVDVLCYLLCMENRLSGLLNGPWVNPHYSKFWREGVVKTSGVASLKYFLLMLEANLNRLVLTPDWIKHVDCVTTMGSASHIVTTSSRLFSKLHGIRKKRAHCSDIEPKPLLNAASGLGILWWRGGKLSRDLFNWKVLPRKLASKAARQAGCTKVADILYPENSDFTKRSRFVVWKAAVEASTCVAQLALQVRELDANIRWDDIENTHILPKMDQSKKIVRSSFKKAIIRRKLTEGMVVKYLLDFGKRRFIPDVVLNHGSIVEESSSERKKYWLEDTFVPLHLMKAFEDRRLARKCNMNPGKNHFSDLLTQRTSKRKGLPYLFAKAERPKYHQCGHCQKNVLISEALCCLHCKGFFHKKHVKRCPGAKAPKYTYSCHKCQNGKIEKSQNKKGKKVTWHENKNSLIGSRVLRSKTKKKVCKNAKPKQKLKNNKKDYVVLPLRRSPRKLKCVSLKNKKVGKRKKGKGKGKKINVSKRVANKSKKSTWQKKRTLVRNAYWLNGIRFSRKPHDERVVLFKEKIIMPSSLSSVSMANLPRCSLSCEKDFTASLSYISCEICCDWFHGDAFGLAMEKIDSIIGFRCNKCRAKISPICPHMHKETEKEEFEEVKTCDGDKKLEGSLSGGQSTQNDQELDDVSFPMAFPLQVNPV